MSRILTRAQVHALLESAVGSSDAALQPGRARSVIDTSSVLAYDFRRPWRARKDQLRRFELIHEDFAGALSGIWSTSLRTIVDVDLVRLDQITYTEFITSLTSPSCSYIYRMRPLDGACVIDFASGLALAMVERALGGRRTSPRPARELTALERHIMEPVAGRVLARLVDSWGRLLASTVEITGFESNPQFLQILGPGDTVMVVTLQVEMAPASGTLTICYPHAALECLPGGVTAPAPSDSPHVADSPTEGRELRRAMLRQRVPVAGRLAQADVTLRDLLALKPGSIVPLSVQGGDPVTLMIAGNEKFKATPGAVGNRRAVRIVESLTMEGE